MAISMEINTFVGSLDMYGEPDISSAYSLSGHITISLSSTPSLFSRRRQTTRLILKSLVLAFEGQSEAITPSIGYTGIRLFSISQELAPPTSIELSNEGREENIDPCQWVIVFDLRIPGWLPESDAFGTENAGSSYGLYATAEFINLGDKNASPWLFTALCTPFRSKLRTVQARKEVVVRRFLTTPSPETVIPETYTYLVHSPKKPSCEGPQIPVEVLAKIQVLASVPQFVQLADENIPLTLRLRTKDLEEGECRRLQVAEFNVDIYQRERFRHAPNASYRFPLLESPMQPPYTPLRRPHPLSNVYDIGLYLPNSAQDDSVRSFSLLSRKESGRYDLSPNNYVFANDANPCDDPTWYTLDASIPFLVGNIPLDKDADWAGRPILRPTTTGPLITVQHELAASVTVTYDMPDGSVARERLEFHIPLAFGLAAPVIRPPPPPPLETTDDALNVMIPLMVSPAPYAPVLPMYSQLFDMNGNQKVDYSVPLPLYAPSGLTQLTISSLSTVGTLIATSTQCSDEQKSVYTLDVSEADEQHPLLSTS